MRYVGDGFAVDATAFTVELRGARVSLEPQAMDLLLYMIARPGELLTKIELLDNVWGDQFVGDSALATRVKQVRAALGDDGRRQEAVQTVHGRGYKFIAEVSVITTPSGDNDPLETGSSIPERYHNIPASRTEMIGRTDLLVEVRNALSDDRLVTLVGLGGAGKTTLAQAVGREMLDRFLDGVWFVDLVPVRDTGGLIRAVADAIGVQSGSGSSAAELIDSIHRRDLCIVLDNCEHLARQAAELCAAMLDAVPDLRIIATSREPLRVAGEHRISVGPLPIVDADGGALDLLEAVARRAGTTIPEHDQIAALELCHRVDGLPLAIEILGARLTTFSLPEIVDRLDRLDALDIGGSGERPDRHETLAAVLIDTLESVDADVVRFLTTLARFSASFGVDDAEQLAHLVGIESGLHSLSELVDRSLVIITSDSPRRFGVLESVRQHVGVHDPDPEVTATAHAEWCLSLVGVSVSDQFHDMKRADLVSAHLQDLLDARTFLMTADRSTDAARVVAATGLAMHLDDGSRAGPLLELLDGHTHTCHDPALRCRLHCSAVMAAMGARRHEAMYHHGERAVDAADCTDDATLMALARIMRSWAGVILDVESALVDLDDAIRLAESVDDHETAVMAAGYQIHNLAMALRFDEAIALCEQRADDRFDRDISARGDSYPHRVMSTAMICCLYLDDPRLALELDERVRAGATSASFWGMAIMRMCCLARLGEVGQVSSMVHDLESRLDRAGITPLPDILLVPAVLALTRDDHDRASRYLGALRASATPTQSLLVSTAYRVLRNHVAPASAESIAASTAEVWNEARAWLASSN